MKHIKEFNTYNQLTFDQFKSNLTKENDELNDLISQIPINLLLKAKKEISKLNVLPILKRIYNYIIGNKNESFVDYMLGLGGLHGVITLAKWFKDFVGKKIYKYFLMLFGLDDETASRHPLKLFTKLTFMIVFVTCLIIRICWINGAEVKYGFHRDMMTYGLNVSYYSGGEGDKIVDAGNNIFILSDNGEILYNKKVVGYIKDDGLYNHNNVKVLNDGSYDADKNTVYHDINLIELLDIQYKPTKYDKQIDDLEKKAFKLDSISNSMTSKMEDEIEKLKKLRGEELLENVSQAKSILRNNNKLETDIDYLKIKELLKNNLGYCGLFTKFFFNDNESYESLVRVYNKIVELGNKIEFLDKNVIEYDTLENLEDGLNRIEDKIFVNKVWNLLPSAQKSLFLSKYTLQHERREFNSIDLTLKDTPDILKQFEKKLSSYKSAASLLAYMRNLTQCDQNYEDTLLKCKKTSNVYVRYANKEKSIIIVRVGTFKATQKLAGHTNWCIARDEYYFKNYSSKGQQFILFDLKRDSTDPFSIIGITVDTDSNIINAHSKEDANVLGLFNSHYRHWISDKQKVSFFPDLELTFDELSKYIKYKPDSPSDYISALVNQKHVKKFLDFY